MPLDETTLWADAPTVAEAAQGFQFL